MGYAPHKKKALSTEQGELLRGIFEMDETYLSHRHVSKNNKNEKDDDDNHKGGYSNKTHTSVIAFKEKGGDLKAFVTADTTSATSSEIIMHYIHTGLELHTDEYNTYKFTRKFFRIKKC